MANAPDFAGDRLLDTQHPYRQLAESGLLGMMIWTPAGGVLEANDTFLALVGYDRADLDAGRIDWSEITPVEHRHLDALALREIEERGACTPYQKEYLRKDGTRAPVMIGGMWLEKNRRGVAFVVDFSAHRARLEADFRLRAVAENAPLVLWSVDRDGIFTLSEGKGLEALGLKPGQVVGMSAFAVYADVPAVGDFIRRGLAGEEFHVTVTVAGRVFETLYRPLRDAAGEVSGLLGVSFDVTQRHEAEKERMSLHMQLLQVQKLESLGLLAGGIAHDFNNILTAVLGSASTALLSLAPEHPACEDVQNVVTAARRAADLTRQMLAYSGKGHFEIRPIDLSRLVRELASLLETTISKKVQLRLELAPVVPAVEADVAQAQQVVMNLVINAAEAIGDKPGTVLVTSGVQDVDEVYAKGLVEGESLEPGRYVFVEVHDTGCGMDDSTRSKIFDPFFTTKFTGRGLGLAAVLGIMRAHRGAIRVYSHPGRGSTFKVFFRASGAAAALPAIASPELRGEGKALVIDDDAAVRRTVRRMLEHFGYEVLEGEDGRRGAAVFAQHADEITIVILDMTMPVMSGEEAFRELRRIRPDVSVILSSGYNEVEATGRFTSKGLAGFLQKPFSQVDLAAKIAAALKR